MMMKSLFSSILLTCIAVSAIADDRIVTAGGTITEIVFALGAGDKVVAIDQSSMYPPEARKLPSVGYYRDMAAEGVLSTNLTHLFALEGSGRDNVLKQITAAGIPINKYKKSTKVEHLFQTITALGKDLGKEQEAAQLIKEIKASLPEPVTKIRTKGLFLLSSGDRGIIAAGQDTVPQLYFDYLGVDNLAKNHSGFKPLGLESLAASQPDFIIAPAHVVYGAGGKEAFCQQKQLALLEAAQNCNLLVMDSLLGLGMTPRIAQAISQIDEFISQQQLLADNHQ